MQEGDLSGHCQGIGADCEIQMTETCHRSRPGCFFSSVFLRIEKKGMR